MDSPSDQIIVNTEEWLQLSGEKKPGVLMLSRVPNDINGMAAAYFKYPPAGQDGPISANEYVACRLGLELGLPMATVQFKEFDAKKGILSFLVATEAVPWSQIPAVIKNDLTNYLSDYEVLSYVAVFDTFINNIDRHAENFMASRIQGRTPKYQVHLIDHGHALLGPTTTPTANQYAFPQHIMIQEIQSLKQNGFAFFESALKAVTELAEEKINEIVDQVPDDYISTEQRAQMKSLLLERQKTIYNEFKTYVETT